MLRFLFSPRGRLNRLSYLLASLALTAAFVAVDAGFPYLLKAIVWLFGPVRWSLPVLLWSVVGLRIAISLPLLWIGAALAARRLHDTNCSGRNVLWIFGLGVLVARLPLDRMATVLLVALLAPLVLGWAWILLMPGTRGTNAYGSQPSLAG